MYYGYRKKKRRFEARQRELGEEDRKKFPLNRFQRVKAQIQVEESGEIFNARVFLHDLNEIGVSVFLTEPLRRGQRIFLVIEQPRHFFMRGEIVWCSLFRLNTRVISAENYQYRAGIRFVYDEAIDRDAVPNYFKLIVET